MTEDTENVWERTFSEDSFSEIILNWFHVPLLAILMGVMFWLRTRTYDQFIRNDQILFSGNDPWYHLRMVRYTVKNWPWTMPFDPWTQFPYGTFVGQFGTLFDQLIATAALIIGLGNPSAELTAKILLISPAIFGALVAIPTFLIGKRLAGRNAGLFGVLVLALLPGTFFRRGLVGFADHHIAEVLFMSIAMYFMLVALTVANREKPIWELVIQREVEELRQPIIWSAAAGLAAVLYIWIWPPGVLIIGIFGLFFLLQLSSDYLRGISPEHLGFVAAVSMGVASLLIALTLNSFSFEVTVLSITQVLLAISVAAGAVFMGWFARVWDNHGYSRWGYPGTIAGILLAGLLFINIALPDLYNLLEGNLFRVIGFGTAAQTRTIGEAQPFLSRTQPEVGIVWYDVILREYGLALFTGIIGIFGMIYRASFKNEFNPGRFLVIIWSIMMIAAAFTQVRFNYYLAVPVAVLNAYLFQHVLNFVDLSRPLQAFTNDEITLYQLLVVFTVILLVIIPLTIPVTIGEASGQSYKTETVVERSTINGPGDGIPNWDPALQWMQNETPREGTYGGESRDFPYYGKFERTEDYDYPAGTYGVMSWWDYGHWITVRGARIPNANPFQQGANVAADYLLAQNEADANAVLEEVDEDDATTRYVMIDWKMITPNSKFFAPTVFKDEVSRSNFVHFMLAQQGQQYGLAFYLQTQSYYQTQMVRMYHFHGSGVDPQPIVIDWDRFPGPGAPDNYKLYPQGQDASVVRTFDNMSQARAFVEQDGTAQVGGVGPFPSEPIPALQHYRLVHMTESSATSSFEYVRYLQQISQATGVERLHQTNPGWVKTFERVPGAKIEGRGPPNQIVTAQVELAVPTKNSTFTYRQRVQTDEDGSFSMTLPYSSTGYENWGPSEGYTNTSVRATGPYQFTTQPEFNESQYLVRQNATKHVPERAVIGEQDASIEIELTDQVIGAPASTVKADGKAETTNASSQLDRNLHQDSAPITS